MPIEFPCPTCHQQVRTPDAAAGKKGKCPNCGTLVIIPAPAVVVPPSSPPVPKPQTPQSPPKPELEYRPPSKPEPAIRPLIQPKPPDVERRPPAPKPPNPAPLATPAPAPAAAAATGGSAIEFSCPTCHKIVRTPAAAGGKKGKCPHCQAVVQIPTRTTLPVAKPLPSAGASPSPSKSSAAKPLTAKPIPKPQPEIIDLEEMPADGPQASGATPGLTPLGSGLVPLGSGLTPLGGGLTPLPSPGANPYSGLTPLGLTPLGPAPASPPAPDPFAGLTPLSSYPAVTPPATNPLGLPASSMGGSPNPYASPSPFGSGYGQPAYQTRTINDSHRRGLPWERDPSMDSFGETMNLVLGSPQEAFSNMRRTGGFGNPIGFMIIGMVIGQIANAIYYGIIGPFLQAAAGERPFNIEALVIVGAIQLVGGVIGAVIFAPVITFIISGVYHLLLVIVGGANAGYEATFRSVCFVNGSTSILMAIPCVGPILVLFFSIFCLIYAFANAHETSGGKAAFSVLGVMFGLLVCSCGCGIMFVLPAIASAMNQLP